MMLRRVVVLLLCAATAAAEPINNPFERGRQAYDLGKYEEAIEWFEKAYELTPEPAILYDIAQAYRQLGDAERALFFYKRYLAASPDAKNRADVEAFIADLEGRAEAPAPDAAVPAPPDAGWIVFVDASVPEPDAAPRSALVIADDLLVAGALAAAAYEADPHPQLARGLAAGALAGYLVSLPLVHRGVRVLRLAIPLALGVCGAAAGLLAGGADDASDGALIGGGLGVAGTIVLSYGGTF